MSSLWPHGNHYHSCHRFKRLQYLFYAEEGGTLWAEVVGGVEDFFPTYKLVSILYAPPGNQSYQGYSEGTMHGTSTSIAQSFGDNVTIDESAGIAGVIQAGGSWSWSTTSAFTYAESQIWSDATTTKNPTNTNYQYYNPTQSNMISHQWDEFVIWLNPEVIINGDYTGAEWEATIAPIAGLDDLQAVLIGEPAQAMEAQPAGVTVYNPSGQAGVTAVPVADLEPGVVENTSAVTPGLAQICANQALYQEQLAWDIANPGNPNPISGQGAYCTQSNQCGCVPSDFAWILEQDPLLNYNSTTYQPNTTCNGISCPQTGYPPTTDPRTLDGAGVTVCSAGSIPDGSDCRYVIVESPEYERFGINEPLNYTQNDENTASFTSGLTTAEAVGQSIQAGLPGVFTLKITDTWTWSDTQSTQTTSGSTNGMQLQLQTSTESCAENVTLFEDTIYHTFAFSVPSNWQDYCP